MDRRQAVGLALAGIVLVANAAVWLAGGDSERTPPDTRELLRRQLVDRIDDADFEPIERVVERLTTVTSTSDEAEERRNPAGFGEIAAFRSLPDRERVDLIEAIGGAVSAIAAGDPASLVAFMADRGLEPDAQMLARATAEEGLELAGRSAGERFASLWGQAGLAPHWLRWAPDETAIAVWKPRSASHVSTMQLGRNESWALANKTVFGSFFGPRPKINQSVRGAAPLLADVRVLVEHDDTLDEERSLYFFRFWLANEAPLWRPLALKLVRGVQTDPETPAPTLVF